MATFGPSSFIYACHCHTLLLFSPLWQTSYSNTVSLHEQGVNFLLFLPIPSSHHPIIPVIPTHYSTPRQNAERKRQLWWPESHYYVNPAFKAICLSLPAFHIVNEMSLVTNESSATNRLNFKSLTLTQVEGWTIGIFPTWFCVENSLFIKNTCTAVICNTHFLSSLPLCCQHLQTPVRRDDPEFEVPKPGFFFSWFCGCAVGFSESSNSWSAVIRREFFLHAEEVFHLCYWEEKHESVSI